MLSRLRFATCIRQPRWNASESGRAESNLQFELHDTKGTGLRFPRCPLRLKRRTGFARTAGFWHNRYWMFLPRLKSFKGLRKCPALLLFSLGCFLLPAAAQQSTPTVTFTCDFPGSEPDHYVIAVSEDGSASYDSESKLSPESDESDSFHLDFTVSQAARVRVFDLAKRAHYFEGEIDSRKKNLASTGAKTLAYKDAQKSTHATYNYSPLPPVQELTAFFQSLSATLEFGHRLDYYLRYQKLALDEELKRMEEMSNSGGLEEILSVAPILEKIKDDPSVINVVRARAQRLLQAARSKSK